MGPLNLPTGGLVYLDANGLIYSVERVEPYRTLLEPMWRAAQDGDITLVSGPILIVETLVRGVLRPPLSELARARHACHRDDDPGPRLGVPGAVGHAPRWLAPAFEVRIEGHERLSP